MSLATFGYERFQEAARVAECAWLRTRIHVRVGESPYRRPRYSCGHGIRYRSLLAQLADVRKMLHGLMTRLADSSSSTVSSVSAKGDKRRLKRTVPRLAADGDQRSAGGG